MIPLRQLLQILGGIAGVIFLNGCQTSEITMDYAPQKNVIPITGAEHVPVKLDVVDRRVKQWVGQVPTYDSGDEFIYATNDVVAVLKKSLGDELVSRGFKLSGSGVPVLVRIDTLWGGNTLFGARVGLNVEVREMNGMIAYSTSVTGKARSHIFWWDDGKIVKAALDDALRNCLANLFADKSFTTALLRTNGSLETGQRPASLLRGGISYKLCLVTFN